MNYELEPDQVENYQKNGYLFPFEVLTSTQVNAIQAEFAQAQLTATENGLADELPALLRTNAQLILPFVHRIARSCKIIDRVTSLLGPNLLLWSAEFFIKGAQTEKIVSWHQDLTYWGLGETDDEITVWLALSQSNVESGCMRFIPGSHHERILPHKDTFAENNALSRGQEIDVEINEDEAVNIELEPGQASFHHGRIFHASGPNKSKHDRVGLVFRFLTPQVKQLVAKRDYAMLVHGIDNTNNWTHVAPPLRNFDPQDLELRQQIQADQSAALSQGAQQALHMTN